MVNWENIRKQFPAAEKYAYFNIAGGAPLSSKAANECKRFYDEMLQEADTYWEKWLERTEETRAKVARFLNADPREICFTLNTSHGMNLVADMLKGKGNVLTMDDEFPSSTIPWLHRKYGVSFMKPKDGAYTLSDIERHATAKTKILVTSHVQYSTGFRQDIVEVGKWCKKRKIIFVVNATQSFGAFPVDVRKAHIDFLVFSGYKWPMAGYCVGVLYINKKWFRDVRFPVAGWNSVSVPELKDNRSLDLKKDARELEVGCPNFPNIFALGGALDFLNKIGTTAVEKKISELDDYLVQKLRKENVRIVTPLYKQCRSGITVIDTKHPKDIVRRLAKKNIIVSTTPRGVRISLSVYNNRSDIDKLVSGLVKLVC